jgi:3-oxoacyl-[acyl-carrier protein] reductase
MAGDLRGRVALVTGGYRGIGRAVCLALAREGARVAVNHRASPREARTLVSRLRARAPAGAFRADVSSPRAVEAMVRDVRRRFGRIDILVNAASYSSLRGWKVPLEEMDPGEVRRTLEVDLLGTFLCCRAVAPLMRRQRGGSIVNFASAAAIAGDPTTLLYAGAKMGVVGLTRALARDLAPRVRVNAVAPGSIRTGWLDGWGLTARERKELLGEIPLGRIGEPEEVAEVVRFLAGPRADFITGQTWIVDGGAVLSL